MPLVPVAWAAVLFAFMRPDAIEARDDVPFEVKWLVYDESDLGALAVRGANAHTGRLPGRRDEPPEETAAAFAAKLDAPPAPLADRYYLEYPTATLPVFRLGYLFAPRDPSLVPPAVADGQHYEVAHFVPRTDAERVVWGRLRTAARVIVGLMAASLVGLVLVVGRGYEPGGPRPPVWLAVLPGAVFFSLNRFDVLPAFLTAAGFACLGRGRPGWSGVFVAAAALVKVYPVLFAPVVLRYLGPARGARWLAGFALTGLAGVGISVLALGWDATVGPVQVQFSRPFEENGWTLYGAVLPAGLAESRWGRLGLVAAAVLAAAATRPADLSGVLRRCGAVLTVFVVLAVFWSPQWIVWFLPILVPLASRRWWVVAVTAGLDLANYFSFPIVFWILLNRMEDEAAWEALRAAMTGVRGVLWLLLLAGLVWDEWRAGRERRPPANAG